MQDNEPKINKLIIYRDPECEMMSIYLNGESIGFGNYWDFHNGGICNSDDFTFGKFRTYSELISNIKKMFNPIDIINKRFSYERSEYYD